MFRFLVVAFFFVSAYGARLPDGPILAMDWQRNGRIVGGQNADISDAPYQVALLYGRPGGSYSQSCGGSIMSANIVITAAHCPYGSSASNWKIRVGSTQSTSGGQVIDVQKFSIHPQFSYSTIDYDISIYYLANPISMDGVRTAAIPLPSQGQGVNDGSPAFITGWGSTREGGSTVATLQKVTIPTVNQQKCADAYSGSNKITDRMLCAGNFEQGGQDACQGDSGGPLAINGILFGVTSWGRGCARAGYPGVWARVPTFVDWINSQV